MDARMAAMLGLGSLGGASEASPIEADWSYTVRARAWRSKSKAWAEIAIPSNIIVDVCPVEATNADDARAEGCKTNIKCIDCCSDYVVEESMEEISKMLPPDEFFMFAAIGSDGNVYPALVRKTVVLGIIASEAKGEPVNTFRATSSSATNMSFEEVLSRILS